MAQSTLHVSLGMLVATAWHIRPLLQSWSSAQPMAKPIARWITCAWILGTYAVIPALLRRIFDLDLSHSAWNIFLLYPLIDNMPLPGILLGECLLGATIGLQYALILLLLYRYTKMRKND